jgi:hypothetical protein
MLSRLTDGTQATVLVYNSRNEKKLGKNEEGQGTRYERNYPSHGVFQHCQPLKVVESKLTRNVKMCFSLVIFMYIKLLPYCH